MSLLGHLAGHAAIKLFESVRKNPEAAGAAIIPVVTSPIFWGVAIAGVVTVAAIAIANNKDSKTN